MRRMTVVLLVVFVLASVLGAVAPVQANDDRHGHKRDRYRHDYYYGRPRGHFDGYRPSRFIVVPRRFVAVYPEYVTVVQPVIYDDVILLPRYRYRVLERHRDQFLLIFGTGNLTVILRG